jgi:hypothetical protein
MAAYSILGLRDPSQWGIGGDNSAFGRFGTGFIQGMAQGNEMDTMLRAQQSRQTTQPYKDTAEIAKSRAATARAEAGSLEAIPEIIYNACEAEGWASPYCKDLKDKAQQRGLGALNPIMA